MKLGVIERIAIVAGVTCFPIPVAIFRPISAVLGPPPDPYLAGLILEMVFAVILAVPFTAACVGAWIGLKGTCKWIGAGREVDLKRRELRLIGRVKQAEAERVAGSLSHAEDQGGELSVDE